MCRRSLSSRPLYSVLLQYATQCRAIPVIVPVTFLCNNICLSMIHLDFYCRLLLCTCTWAVDKWQKAIGKWVNGWMGRSHDQYTITLHINREIIIFLSVSLKHKSYDIWEIVEKFSRNAESQKIVKRCLYINVFLIHLSEVSVKHSSTSSRRYSRSGFDACVIQ